MSNRLGEPRPDWEKRKPKCIPTKGELLASSKHMTLKEMSARYNLSEKILLYWLKEMEIAPYSLEKKEKTFFEHTGERHKQYAVDFLGGKCMRCGYSEFLPGLAFHHLDPKTKDKSFRTVRCINFQRIRKELKKCICLCMNCHTSLHARQWNIDEVLK